MTVMMISKADVFSEYDVFTSTMLHIWILYDDEIGFLASFFIVFVWLCIYISQPNCIMYIIL